MGIFNRYEQVFHTGLPGHEDPHLGDQHNLERVCDEISKLLKNKILIIKFRKPLCEEESQWE